MGQSNHKTNAYIQSLKNKIADQQQQIDQQQEIIDQLQKQLQEKDKDVKNTAEKVTVKSPPILHKVRRKKFRAWPIIIVWGIFLCLTPVSSNLHADLILEKLPSNWWWESIDTILTWGVGLNWIIGSPIVVLCILGYFLQGPPLEDRDYLEGDRDVYLAHMMTDHQDHDDFDEF